MSGERSIFELPDAQFVESDNPQLRDLYLAADALHTLLFPADQSQATRMQMLNAMLLELGRVAAMIESEGGEQEFGGCIEHHKQMFLERENNAELQRARPGRHDA